MIHTKHLIVINMHTFFGITVAALFMSTVITAKEVCPLLERPSNLNIKEMMGTWYAVRGIEHTKLNGSATSKTTKHCPVIILKLKTEDSIEFRWQSKDKPERKFDLKINSKVPSLWEYKASKKGNRPHAPFRSLQVTSVPDNYEVWSATMCKAGGRLASVVLSRQPKFSEDEVTIVTKSLTSQGLSTENTFDRCK